MTAEDATYTDDVWQDSYSDETRRITRWTCSRCGGTGTAMNLVVAGINFRTYHWKTAECTRFLRQKREQHA